MNCREEKLWRKSKERPINGLNLSQKKMTRPKKIIYWISTVDLAFGLLSSGIQQLLHFHGISDLLTESMYSQKIKLIITLIVKYQTYYGGYSG